MPDEPLLTYQQASQVLGVPRGTLYALVHHNRVPHIRLGRRLVRFDRRQLEEFIDAHRIAPSDDWGGE